MSPNSSLGKEGKVEKDHPNAVFGGKRSRARDPKETNLNHDC